jgi:hypothetical protein
MSRLRPALAVGSSRTMPALVGASAIVSASTTGDTTGGGGGSGTVNVASVVPPASLTV